MNALIKDLSENSIEILKNALREVYGEGTIELVNLNENVLRQRVRLATRGNGLFETVLILLSKEDYEACRDIVEDASNMFVYVEENEIVGYLNKRYSLNIEIKSENSGFASEGESVNNNINVRFYEERIRSLSAQVKELEDALEEGGYNDEKSIEVDFEGVNKEEYEKLRNERENLEKVINDLKKSKSSLVSSLESTSAELDEFKAKYSMQKGVIDAKNKEIERLESKSSEVDIDSLKFKIQELNEKIEELKALVIQKENECKAISDEMDVISSEKVSLSDTLSKVRNDLKLSVENNESLKKELESYKKGSERVELLTKELSDLSGKVQSLESTHLEDEKTIIELNKEILEKQERLTVLEKSTSRDTDIESLVKELSTLRQKYDSLQNNIYTKVAGNTDYNKPLGLSLAKGNESFESNYSNIRFVYAGSTESRKGMYKSLLSEFSKGDKSNKVIIVDVVSETSIDYVFEIKSLKCGINWFMTGEDLLKNLSKTCLENVNVLSIGGTRYINDSYFLTIDWVKRLKELQESGYSIVLVCGDISNMVGRVLHESLAGLGNSFIYVMGNAVSSRAVITNIRGLSNAKESVICYFDFNKQVQKYVDIAKRVCDCRILSVLH